MKYTNQTTQELTTSLQALTARNAQGQGVAKQGFPRSIPAKDVTVAREVRNFLESRRSYEARTRTVSIGRY
jgi:hypothetical protein